MKNFSPLIDSYDKNIDRLQSICKECLKKAKSYGFTKEEIINELKNK